MQFTHLRRKRFTEPEVDVYPLFVEYTEPNHGDLYITRAIKKRMESADQVMYPPEGGDEAIAFLSDKTWHVINSRMMDVVLNTALSKNPLVERIEKANQKAMEQMEYDQKKILLLKSVQEILLSDTWEELFQHESKKEVLGKASSVFKNFSPDDLKYSVERVAKEITNLVSAQKVSPVQHQIDLIEQNFEILHDGTLKNKRPVVIEWGKKRYDFGFFIFKTHNRYWIAKPCGENNVYGSGFDCVHPFISRPLHENGFRDVCLGVLQGNSSQCLEHDQRIGDSSMMLWLTLNRYGTNILPYAPIKFFKGEEI